MKGTERMGAERLATEAAAVEDPAMRDAELSELRRDGFAVARQLVPRATLERLRAEIEIGLREHVEKLIASGRLAVSERDQASDFESGYAFLQARSLHEFDPPLIGNVLRPAIAKVLDAIRREAAIVEVAKRFLGPPIVATPQFALRAHCPERFNVCFPWHQDVYFLKLTSEEKASAEILNFWIPLLPIDAAAGGLDVIRGSHEFGVLEHVKGTLADGAPVFQGVAPHLLPGGDAVAPDFALGDALLLTDKTVHRTRMNHSNRVRWSLDIRYTAAGRPLGRQGRTLRIG